MLHRLSIFTFAWFLSVTLMVAGSTAQEQREQEEGTSRGVRALENAGAETGEAGPSRTYANRHALVIGINDYEDPGYPDLGYAVADAQAIAKIVVEQFKFEEQNVKLLLNGDATKDAIEEALEEWAADVDRVGEEDLLVVFFAGHGVTRDLGSRGSRGYLVPVDGEKDRKGRPAWSSVFGMNELEDISEAIPAKHALFILDCCFGGLAVKRSDPPVAAGLTSRARQVITAGGADQEVLDTGGGGHSVFTGALLSAMRGDADLDGDGAVTFGEIFNHVGREVQRKTEDVQTPLQSTFPDHGGGCVALFTPGLEPGRQSIHERLDSLQLTLAEKLNEIERLSDIVQIRTLKREAADTLWPGLTLEDSRYRDWLVRAREVSDRLPLHKDALTRVRQQVYLEQVLAGVVEEGEGTEPDWESAEADSRFRFETFGELVREITEDLTPLIAQVESRRATASEMYEATIGDQKAAWDEAIASIANREECPQYDGLVLTPQLGLIPIGRDPESGLWEFGLWKQTGEIPRRGTDGKLVLEERSSLVFVLIPGGTFHMGATSTRSSRAEREGIAYNFDPQAEGDESPVHEVTLDAFFLSKYEMTQGQWALFTRTNPSRYGPHSYASDWDRAPAAEKQLWLHPLEQVDWHTCDRVLAQLSLALPTEAQWEYAARAGTSMPWWTGSEKETLQDAANLADRYAKANGGQSSWACADWLDDGFTAHAPVGRFRANAFGLHDMAGNVWEWCRDEYGDYNLPRNPGDGERLLQSPGHVRIYRGGSFLNTASSARSACRYDGPPEIRNGNLGLRPVRVITE